MDNKKMYKFYYDKINELLEYRQKLYKYDSLIEELINLCESHIHLIELLSNIEKEINYNEKQS